MWINQNLDRRAWRKRGGSRSFLCGARRKGRKSAFGVCFGRGFREDLLAFAARFDLSELYVLHDRKRKSLVKGMGLVILLTNLQYLVRLSGTPLHVT